VLVLDLMAHDGSLVLEVVEAARAEIPSKVERHEERADSSPMDQSSNTRHESATASQGKESTVVNVSEVSRSYLFGPSTAIVEGTLLRVMHEQLERRLFWSL
jgi:hypothetical protein